MKMLHYAALEPVQRLRALQTQTYESLRPSGAYLRAAIRAAKERQVRYRVSWQRPEVRRAITLTALDTVFEVRPSDGRFEVHGLPPTVNPALLPPKLIVQWTDFVDVRTVEVSDGRVLVSLDTVLADDLELSWAGTPVTLSPAAAAPAPRMVFDAQCGALDLVLVEPLPDGGHRVVVAGVGHDRLFTQNGDLLATRSVPWRQGLSRIDGAGVPLTFAESLDFEVAELPPVRVLRGDNGVRFSWLEPKVHGRPVRGEWVQLLPLEESERDVGIDPRAAFCEEGVREVRVELGRNRGEPYAVRGFKRESYQLLLDPLPPEGTVLQLPINIHNLMRQREAVETLCTAPQPHHRGLLRLLENPAHVVWPPVGPIVVDDWHLLTDASLDGTDQQRSFVKCALATPDFALLEGPPGSGKTHAICELILQLLGQGLRVLLCSTTHVAVDNVLERIVGRFPGVDAVRIGAFDRVDERVRPCQLGARVDALVDAWAADGLDGQSDTERRRIAEALILTAANLTCGTTTGILAHPHLRQAGHGAAHFDVLILDEASKTTFQEFLVPALHTRRWIIVGDVRQLPPFTERHDLEASLEELSNGDGKRLSPAHQRALLLWSRLTSRMASPGKVRWLVVEEDEVLDALVAEFTARQTQDASGPSWIRIDEHSADRAPELSIAPPGQSSALRVLTADCVLVSPRLLARDLSIHDRLPPDLLAISGAPNAPVSLHRRGHWRSLHPLLPQPVRERGKVFSTPLELEQENRAFMAEHTWAGEVGWRLGRFHQLSQARNEEAQQGIGRELAALSPRTEAHADWARNAMIELLDVGMRSVLEALRLGRPDHQARRSSALTDALPEAVWASRAVLLSFQHRMHPEISRFPREMFYEDKALRDANTIARRPPFFFGGFPARRAWLDVEGHEVRGVNLDEVRAMRAVLERWRRECTGARADGRPWEIACLAFYNRQELALRDMLRDLTGQRNRQTRFELPHTELVCGTVDRFQGREADLVLLTLRNTSRIGYLDSPNRLNVALTRGRHQLVIVGRHAMFRACGLDELEALALETPRVNCTSPGWRTTNSSLVMSGRGAPARP